MCEVSSLLWVAHRYDSKGILSQLATAAAFFKVFSPSVATPPPFVPPCPRLPPRDGVEKVYALRCCIALCYRDYNLIPRFREALVPLALSTPFCDSAKLLLSCLVVLRFGDVEKCCC